MDATIVLNQYSKVFKRNFGSFTNCEACEIRGLDTSQLYQKLNNTDETQLIFNAGGKWSRAVSCDPRYGGYLRGTFGLNNENDFRRFKINFIVGFLVQRSQLSLK